MSDLVPYHKGQNPSIVNDSGKFSESYADGNPKPMDSFQYVPGKPYCCHTEILNMTMKGDRSVVF